MKKLIYSSAGILFILLFSMLAYALQHHTNTIPSPLINQKAPAIDAPNLYNPNETLTNKDFEGQVSLLNVWASWCSSCAEEHDLLMKIHKEVPIFGLSYKDDDERAKAVLAQYGNPFKMIATDDSGSIAINWGVYGTPETFVIDKKGKIRYKFVGILTQHEWQNTLKPLIEKLKQE